MWFVPNWISYPSFVSEYGLAMIPALLMSMSSRVSRARNVSAAAAMLEKEDSSSGRWMISQAVGTADLMAWMAAVALEGVRAAR
jgi:hypothetical protein